MTRGTSPAAAAVDLALADELLARLKPFDVWRRDADPAALAAASRLGSSPQRFYDNFRRSLLATQAALQSEASKVIHSPEGNPK